MYTCMYTYGLRVDAWNYLLYWNILQKDKRPVYNSVALGEQSYPT